MKKIPLSQGLFAIVSDEDFDRVNQFKWTASNESRGKKKWYAIRYEKMPDGKRKKIRMSRFILGLSDGDIRVVDHLDGDGLDNRRENLDVVYQDENMRRARGWSGHGSSKPKPKSNAARKTHNRRTQQEEVPEDSEGTCSGAVQCSLFREDEPASA